MPVIPAKATVAVVMCTYNGAKHIESQLDSLTAQDWPIAVYAFDDVSIDDTVAKIQAYSNRLDITLVRNEQNLGFVANFEAGINKALADGYEYIALSDQDDVWDSSRVSAGMQRLLSAQTNTAEQTPVLVHSDLTMIDGDNRTVHDSFFAYRGYSIGSTKSLATVLGQNGVMGNTILMNKALAVLALPFPEHLHVHDYWLAVLAELYGCRELLDKPVVSYRIHDSNASNSNNSIKFGTAKLLDGKSWRGFVERDYRLPFKEDSRLHTVNLLLSGLDRYPRLNADQTEILSNFKAYLEFSGSRISLLRSMVKFGFFKKGIKHRLRMIYSILTTKRYNR